MSETEPTPSLLFAAARADRYAIHPAVGVRIRENVERALAGRRRRRRTGPLRAALVLSGAALAIALWPRRTQELEPLLRAHDRPVRWTIGGVSADLHPESALIPGAVPEVLSGEVTFRVDPLAPGETFTVIAGAVRVEVIGTVFRVARHGARVDVAVEEGRVRVLHQAEATLLSAGGRWSSQVPPAVEPPEPEIEEAPRPSRVEALLKESYTRAKASARRSRPAPREDGPETHAPAERPEVAKPTIEEQRSLLDRAKEHLQHGEVAEARAIYVHLIREGEASLPLYLLARLESVHAGRPEAALASLDELLARFPQSPLSPEAAASRIEALIALGRCAEARAATDTFTRAHRDALHLIEGLACNSDEREPRSGH